MAGEKCGSKVETSEGCRGHIRMVLKATPSISTPSISTPSQWGGANGYLLSREMTFICLIESLGEDKRIS